MEGWGMKSGCTVNILLSGIESPGFTDLSLNPLFHYSILPSFYPSNFPFFPSLFVPQSLRHSVSSHHGVQELNQSLGITRIDVGSNFIAEFLGYGCASDGHFGTGNRLFYCFGNLFHAGHGGGEQC